MLLSFFIVVISKCWNIFWQRGLVWSINKLSDRGTYMYFLSQKKERKVYFYTHEVNVYIRIVKHWQNGNKTYRHRYPCLSWTKTNNNRKGPRRKKPDYISMKIKYHLLYLSICLYNNRTITIIQKPKPTELIKWPGKKG